MQMDFYVPTEHNVIHTGWKHTEVMIVPGVEVTAEKGHCNLFGIDRLPSRIKEIICRPASEQAETWVTEILQEAKRKRMACEHQSSVFTCLEMEISFDSTSYGSVSGNCKRSYI